MAEYLVDSNAFFNFKVQPQKLRPQARQAIEDGENRLVVSLASLWELAIKAANGKLDAYTQMIAAGSDALLAELRESGFELLPIELSHALSASRLPQHHRDPFDRLMIAQARINGLTIITSDAIFTRYDVRVLPA